MNARRVSLLLVAAALLTGCSAQLGDRGGVDGAPPDRIDDVDRIEVYRNADNFPNIGRICVEGLAFAATSSGGPSLLRVPEWDGWCTGQPATAVPPVPATTAPPTTVPTPPTSTPPTGPTG